jgi:hypothetical protein
MTLEIRQMVIKSDIARDGGGAAPAQDGADDACGGCGEGGAAEALRSGLAAELERLRER